MIRDNKLWIGTGSKDVYLLPKLANRHGLIAGATGTGKTTTLKVLAEGFSELGVPVFLADIKGDVASLAQRGEEDEAVYKRIQDLKIENFSFKDYPTEFWDVYGEYGLPVRTTISEMGPLLLSKLLGLNEVQTSVLTVIFKISDDKGLLLLDIKDLRAMLQFIYDNAGEYESTYGKMSTSTITAIMRSTVFLEEQGGDLFFGEPALDISDWMKVDENGKGVINILQGIKLFHSQTLYATFLLWMLSEMFERLPEVGDLEKPKLVFFFDEAHLLFRDMPKALISKIEQVVKLIRSKGVGVYFITQAPSDIPDEVLNQLSNKIQHALRAYTPAEQKVIKAAAQSYRVNEAFSTEAVLTELAIGEALVSCLDEEGKPNIVERVMILPPSSYMGLLDESIRNRIINNSLLYNKYIEQVDRESAYELLANKNEEKTQTQLEQPQKQETVKPVVKEAKKTPTKKPSLLEKGVTSTITSIGREVGRQIIRGILGGLK